MDLHVRIMTGGVAHLDQLAEVERAAAKLFPAELLPAHLAGQTLERETLARGVERGLLRVAVDRDERVAGFALLEDRGEIAWVVEVDVHPDFQRRGLGRSLMEDAIALARSRGLARLQLTTFAAAAWNAPFYETLGLRRLGPDELDEHLRRQLAEEARAGLGERVAMELEL